MRKRTVSALMMTLLLLAGCARQQAGPEEAFAALRERLEAAESVTARAALTADYGGTVQEYVLALRADGETVTVTVEEPENIAGVTASAQAGQTALSYEGVMLGAGPLDEEGTTPISALPAILRAMHEGYAELYWQDGSLAAARFYAGESARCTVWLDPETGAPTAAEMASSGRTVIACRFTDWAAETPAG